MMLISILYLAGSCSHGPILWELSAGLNKAVDHLMSMSEYEFFRGPFADRRNPRAKVLYCVLSTVEDFNLTCVEAVMATRPSHVNASGRQARQSVGVGLGTERTLGF